MQVNISSSLLFFILLISSNIVNVVGQSCKDQTGGNVAWWIIIKVPPKIGKSGFGYYDSRMTAVRFTYYDFHIDEGITPLTRTLSAINTASLEYIVWNDEKPSNQTTTIFAHSKGLIAYNPSTNSGFFLSHSLPKYPAFINNTINMTIAPSQNYYGQHLSCFSLTIKELDEIAARLLIIRPWVYSSKIVSRIDNQNLLKLSKESYSVVGNLFEVYDMKSVLGYNLKSIYKNDKLNGSIFEDGLTQYLSEKTLYAETWGRPLEKSWCVNGYQVLNVKNVTLGTVGWNEVDDHAKWVIAGNYVCFGDMNRMESQWKRGGAFYCLSSVSLVMAMNQLVVSHDSC